jgi:hypothetical protein
MMQIQISNNNMIPIGQIIHSCLERPPAFGPKYDAKRMNMYFDLNIDDIVRFLAEYCDNTNYDDDLMAKVIHLTDKQVLNDLRNVLLDTIMDVYMPEYERNKLYEKDKYTVQEECLPHLIQNFNTLIFKRTANTCTPYGYI